MAAFLDCECWSNMFKFAAIESESFHHMMHCNLYGFVRCTCCVSVLSK